MDKQAILDKVFMQEALRQAKLALEADEVPIGAVIVFDNRIVARAHNQVETLKDPTAHAEMIAVTQEAAADGAAKDDLAQRPAANVENWDVDRDIAGCDDGHDQRNF